MGRGGTTDEYVPGIKLFGATINLEIKTDDQRINKEMVRVKGDDDHEEEEEDEDQTAEMKRPEKIIACPRCKSMETKFCYFNNYNVNQPRHFCKGCQRYWTAGGALRNVPVGAGRRKAKPPCHDYAVAVSAATAAAHHFDFQEWHVASVAAQAFKRRRAANSPGSSSLTCA